MNPSSMYSNEVYTIRGDMCYDNKIMLNAPSSPVHQHQQHVVNLSPSDTEDDVKCKKRLRSRIRAPFVLNVALGGIVLAIIAIIELVTPSASPQGFYCKDPSLSFPFRGDTITITIICTITILIPPAVFVCVEYFRDDSFWRNRAAVVFLWLKEYFIGNTFTLLLTEIMKIAYGEHRPHFFYTCAPDTGKDCEPGTYVFEYECTNTDMSTYFLIDTSRSFPSGHASLSTFMAIYCAAYIQQRFPTAKTGEIAKQCLIALSLMWGCICSLSRITDRRHHWWDVLAGMVLGAACAAFALFLVMKNKRKGNKPPRPSASTTTLLDEKNKDATSIAI